MDVTQEDSTLVMCDNQSCIAIAKNPVFHEHTKHIEVHYHVVQELITNSIIELMYCPTSDNLSNVFTKALPREKMEHLIRRMGVGPPLGH